MEKFHTKVCGGKAFAAEQKTTEFKKILLKSKWFENLRKNRIKPNDFENCTKYERDFFK